MYFLNNKFGNFRHFSSPDPKGQVRYCHHLACIYILDRLAYKDNNVDKNVKYNINPVLAYVLFGFLCCQLLYSNLALVPYSLL